MENKHIYKQWENRKPRCEEFGFSESDFPRIKKAIEMYKSKDSFEPSDKLKALKSESERMQKKDSIFIEAYLPLIVVVGIALAIEKSLYDVGGWENAAAALVLIVPLGCVAFEILMFIMCSILGHFDPIINKEYYEKIDKIAKLEEEEKKQHEQYIESTYGKDFALAANLNSYIKAFNYYNDCKNARTAEYWNKFRGGDGNDFERACAKFLKDKGFSTRVTPIGPDKGVDIYASRDGEKYACQCKALRGKVSSGDIQKFIGVLVTGPYKEGFFFSLNGFSLNALEVAYTSPKKIYCLSKKELMEGKIR